MGLSKLYILRVFMRTILIYTLALTSTNAFNTSISKNIDFDSILRYLPDQELPCGMSATLCGKKDSPDSYCCGSDRNQECCLSLTACCPFWTTCCGKFCCKSGDECRADGCYRWEKTTYWIPIGLIVSGLIGICGCVAKCSKGNGASHPVRQNNVPVELSDEV